MRIEINIEKKLMLFLIAAICIVLAVPLITATPATGVTHSAADTTPGTFGAGGAFTFPENLIINGNLGIGTTNLGTYKLNVAGDAIANTVTVVGSATLPTCNSTYRGKQFLLQGASGFEDGFYICKKKADDSYDWIPLGSPQLVRATPDWFSVFNLDSACYLYFNFLPYSSINIWRPGEVNQAYCPFSTNPLFTLPANAQYLTCYFAINLACMPYNQCVTGDIDIRIVCNENSVYQFNVQGNCIVPTGQWCRAVTTPIIPISGGAVQNCHLEALVAVTGIPGAQIKGVCYYVAPQ